MFWRKKARPPGPTGTGRFIENIDWIFWDDAVLPGLINRDTFHKLADKALSKQEASEFLISRHMSGIITDGKRNEEAVKKVEGYYGKLSRHLEATRETNPGLVKGLTEQAWDASNSDLDPDGGVLLLKAFLNVLEHWDYPFQWRDAYDVRGELSAIIVTKAPSHVDRIKNSMAAAYRGAVTKTDHLEYCVHSLDLLRVEGRPSKFVVEFANSIWRFSISAGLVIEPAQLSDT